MVPEPATIELLTMSVLVCCLSSHPYPAWYIKAPRLPLPSPSLLLSTELNDMSSRRIRKMVWDRTCGHCYLISLCRTTQARVHWLRFLRCSLKLQRIAWKWFTCATIHEYFEMYDSGQSLPNPESSHDNDFLSSGCTIIRRTEWW